MAEAACSYDLDQVDDAWLNILNGERAMMGIQAITDEQFERVVEELEVNRNLNAHSIVRGCSFSLFVFLFLIKFSSGAGIKFRPS